MATGETQAHGKKVSGESPASGESQVPSESQVPGSSSYSAPAPNAEQAARGQARNDEDRLSRELQKAKEKLKKLRKSVDTGSSDKRKKLDDVAREAATERESDDDEYY